MYLDAAERRLTGGTDTSDASQWLERAGKVFKGIAANYPDLGETAEAGNQRRWQATLDRMNRLRARASPPLSPIVVKVSKPRAPVEGAEEGEGDQPTTPEDE